MTQTVIFLFNQHQKANDADVGINLGKFSVPWQHRHLSLCNWKWEDVYPYDTDAFGKKLEMARWHFALASDSDSSLPRNGGSFSEKDIIG